MSTHYETLGVHKLSTREEIRDAFRERAKTAHPDAGGDANAFAFLSLAYGVLKDPEKRGRYNAELLFSNPICPDCDGDGVKMKMKGFSRKEVRICGVCRGSGVRIRAEKRGEKR